MQAHKRDAAEPLSTLSLPPQFGRIVDEAEIAKAWLAEIVSSSDDAIFTKDLNGVVTSWNAAAERLYGYSSDEIVGHNISRLIPPDRHNEEKRILARIAAGDRIDHYETRRVAKNGEIVEVALTVSGIPAPSGEIVGASVIARDITEHNRLLSEARAARAEAERANLAKSEFLSRMSHELRTPLSSVLGFGELLKTTDLDQEQTEFVDQIITAGSRLRELINEVLDISRIEAGQFRLSVEPVRLEDVILEDVSLVRPLAQQRGVSITTTGFDGSDHHDVQADRQRLGQVFLNLLSNAVKYNVDGGSVTITVGRTDDMVRVAVADTGPGITEDRLESVFAPFERLDADDTQVEGTGLGLSIARGLVQAMGGRLFVDSAPGRGSIFYVELVASEVAGDSAVEDEHSVAGSGPVAKAGVVLYIEDNPANVRLVSGLLRKRPEVELVSAATAATGLDEARTRNPDLILLDLHLPDGTGEEVLAMLRRDPATHSIPTVILSADAFQEHVERLNAAGADGYLTKPIDFAEFLGMVDRFVAAGSGQAGA